MSHPNEDSIVKKLNHLPKPKLNTEVKNNIYFTLMRDDLYIKGKIPFNTKKLVYSFVGVLVLFIFSFAMLGIKTGDKTHTHSFSLSIDHKDKVDIKKLIPYRESYVGDNSAVVGILHQLPGKQYIKEISLSTKKEPYGIHVDYHSNKIKGFEKYWSRDNTERIFLYNATILFVLIRNVDEVSFDVQTKGGAQSFHTTRKELESFYGVKLQELPKNQTQWENLLNQTFTDNEKVKSFYDKQLFKNIDWTLSPKFKSNKSTMMLGKIGRLGIQNPDFTAKKVGKYLWGFWGDEKELHGPVKIIGMEKNSRNITKVLYNSDAGATIWEVNPLLGPVNGADQHIPCNMYFPSSGVWCLYVYLNNKPFDYIVVKVH